MEKQPKKVDKLILHGTVVTMDESLTQIEDGAVAIKGRDIIAVGAADDLIAQYQANDVIDAAGQIVMPGLISTHTHMAMTLLRGFVGDVTTQDFLERVWPIEREYMTPENVRLGTELAIAEMFRGGITAAMDMYRHPRASANAAREAGFRLVNGVVMSDTIHKDQPPVAERIRQGRVLLKELKDDPLLVPAVLPHSAYTASPETLKQTWALAEEMDVIWHTHAAENDIEVEVILERYGTTSIVHLHSHGLLDRRTVLAHVVSPTDEEIDLLAASGASVAHCPITNMKTAAGFAPLVKFRAAGVPVALGLDTAAANNDMDMWKTMRLAAIIHRGTSKDPTFNPASDVVRMATCDAARVLGLEDMLGALEPGKRADIILVNFDALHLVPLYDVYAQLVFAVGREDVSTVLVNGQVVMRDRVLLTLNEERLIKEARRIGQQIRDEDAARQAEKTD
jgi:5-methylthioadenosine/S-adenosylhomocysteine deaminase